MTSVEPFQAIGAIIVDLSLKPINMKNDLKKKYDPYLNKAFMIRKENETTGRIEGEEVQFFELLTIKIDGKPEYHATGRTLDGKEIQISLDLLDIYGEIIEEPETINSIVLSDEKIFTSIKLQDGFHVRLNSVAIIMKDETSWHEVVEKVQLRARIRNFRVKNSKVPHIHEPIKMDLQPAQPVWKYGKLLFVNDQNLYTTLDFELFIPDDFNAKFEVRINVDHIPRN